MNTCFLAFYLRRAVLGTLAIVFVAGVSVGCSSSRGATSASQSTLSQATSSQTPQPTFVAVPTEEMFDFTLPEPAQPMPEADKRSLWATYYHVWYAEATTASGHALLDMDGKSLTPPLGARDWCMSGVEGTVLVKDEQGKLATYNYAGRGQGVQVECAPFFNKGSLINPVAIGKTRWMLARGPFGDGVKGLILVPFRTIAVDTLTFPIGSVVYIPAARGHEVTLPSGKTVKHDGYFFAGDIGGAIKQTHIDIFGGTSFKNPFPQFVMSKSSGVFDAFVVTDAAILAKLGKIHTVTAR